MLKKRIDEIVEKHGSLRAAARALAISPAYLCRLRNGTKHNPSAALLRRMTLHKIVIVQFVRDRGIDNYCLGNGEMQCDGCQHEKNWQMLNQMPDMLRKPMQARAKRIDDTDCIVSGRPWYIGASR